MKLNQWYFLRIKTGHLADRLVKNNPSLVISIIFWNKSSIFNSVVSRTQAKSVNTKNDKTLVKPECTIAIYKAFDSVNPVLANWSFTKFKWLLYWKSNGKINESCRWALLNKSAYRKITISLLVSEFYTLYDYH